MSGSQGGVLQAFSGAIGNFLRGDSGLGRFADSFKRFNDIDAANIQNLASGIGSLQSAISQDFANQARNIDTFAGSIRVLRTELNELRTSLEALNRGTGFGGTGSSALQQVVGQIARVGTGGGTTNTMVEEQKKLNTMIAELRPVFEATRDNTKNVADNVRERNNPLG